MATAVLITGGNRGDVRARLAEARRLTGELIGEVKRASSCRKSAPWGFEAEEPFWNQVLEVETPLTPHELLEAVHGVEQRLGRDREAERAEKEQSGQAYASRAIDVDILLYDDRIVREPDLQIPHPQMGGREFVLRPLCELMPERRHPETGKTMRELLDALKKR